MCLYGVYKQVKIKYPNKQDKIVPVDACIANEIQKLNDLGVETTSCCCGHGLAGRVVEWDNAFGKWKGYHNPPHVLIKSNSVDLAKEFGYSPYPYFDANNNNTDTWQMVLKTGCLTEDDCLEWHQLNHLPMQKNIGIIA